MFGNVSEIDPGVANQKDEEKVPLDSDALLTLTYWFFLIIACLMSFGLAWDFWIYWKANHPRGLHEGEQAGMYSRDFYFTRRTICPVIS